MQSQQLILLRDFLCVLIPADGAYAVNCTASNNDGWCDSECNTLSSSWDGGDCCADDCYNYMAHDYECGVVPYECLGSSQDHTHEFVAESSTTIPTLGGNSSSAAVPFWWEAEVPSVCLAVFVAILASAILLTGAYVITVHHFVPLHFPA